MPVLRVDQPMADKAVQTGKRIGVIATLPTTLEPTADLIQRRAAKARREIALTSRLCEGAFEALMSGDAARHDAMVAAALKELMAQVEVIVLAQASMARVVDGLSAADRRVPILASPGLAVDYLATVLVRSTIHDLRLTRPGRSRTADGISNLVNRKSYIVTQPMTHNSAKGLASAWRRWRC